MTKNILITAGAGVILSNKGTVAILITTIENIQKIFPDSKIKVELYWPDKQKALYDIRSEFKDVEVIEHPLSRPFSSITALGIAFLSYPLKIVSQSLYESFNVGLFPWLKNYTNCDVIISQSVETFIVYYDEDVKQRIVRHVAGLYTLSFARFFKKKYVLFAQTLAPFGWPFKLIMKIVVKDATLVTLRDDISYDNLKREGAIYDNMHIVADPAFLLTTKRDTGNTKVDLIKDINKIRSARSSGKRTIGVSLARTTGIKLDNDIYLKYVKIVADTVNSLIKDYNSFIVFISHSSGKVRDTQSDSLVGEDIRNLLDNNESFYVLSEDYDPREIKGIISELDLVVSHRMHPVIFALSSKVPCILFGFNEKAYGLMDRFGLREYVVPINDMSKEDILKKVDNVLQNYDDIKNVIDSKMPYVTDLSKKNFELLETTINR